MKVLLLLLLPIFCSAQQDFDYVLYTRHAQSPLYHPADSSTIELTLERRIVKEGSRLLIIPCMNTGNTQEYRIQFQGFGTHKQHAPMNKYFKNDTEMTSLEYATDDLKYYISILPMIPLVEIYEFGSGKDILRYRYY